MMPEKPKPKDRPDDNRPPSKPDDKRPPTKGLSPEEAGRRRAAETPRLPDAQRDAAARIIAAVIRERAQKEAA